VENGDPSAEILQKLTSCLIKWIKRLHRNWLKDTFYPPNRIILIIIIIIIITTIIIIIIIIIVVITLKLFCQS